MKCLVEMFVCYGTFGEMEDSCHIQPTYVEPDTYSLDTAATYSLDTALLLVFMRKREHKYAGPFSFLFNALE